jgi:predicted Zn-ribbon and HTH transcriptional regulator
MARHERIQVFKCKDCGTYFETEVKLDAICEQCLSKNIEEVETYDDID